jgi:hypothetical protein
VKKMKTGDLIHRLGNDLTPVRPLAPPWKRATMWLLIAGLYLMAVVVLAWMRRGALAIPGTGIFVIQQLAVTATAVAAAVAAFVSVIPGANRRLLAAPLAPGAVVMTTLVMGCISDVRIHGTLGLGRETDWPCVVSLTLGGVALWAVGMVMLRRGAPLAPDITSLLAGVAALSVANIEPCLTRPHAFNITVLVWHGLTMALLIAILMHAGRALLTWKTARWSS